MYKAKDEYINTIRRIDNKVLFNKPPVRPYYYINLNLDGVEYALPLSSAKENVKYNPFTQIRIMDKDKELSKIFLINMIPFHENLFDKINYNEYDINYQKLLSKEEYYIKSNYATIVNKATTLYNARYNPNHYKYPMLTRNCCDFKAIEGFLEMNNYTENYFKEEGLHINQDDDYGIEM